MAAVEVEEAATRPAPAEAEAGAVVAGVRAEVVAAADRAGVLRVVNFVKADLRAADPEAAKVFVVGNGFAAASDFTTENDGFETTARGAVTAAASGAVGGTLTA